MNRRIKYLVWDLQLFGEGDPEETKKDETGPEDTSQKYLETIKALKETTVSKETFDKMKKDRDDLLQYVMDGKETDGIKAMADGQKAKAPEGSSVDDLRRELFSPDPSARTLTNLEFATKALELRKKLMDQGEPDPFASVYSPKAHPSQNDLAVDAKEAETFAQTLQSMVEEAEGDPVAFDGFLNIAIKRDDPVTSAMRRNIRKG